MNISYNWIRELVEHQLPPRELAEALTMAGLAVDGVEAVGDDHILEIDLTSNRPDCLSHLGVAREVSAITGNPLKLQASGLTELGLPTSDMTSVEITAPEFCPRYSARIIRGVKVGPSPEWLVKKLEGMGQRSVNNVADITNYVMLEYGQPLHAFDLHQLKGERIIVRKAKPGERITTLDGEERELTDSMLVIADAERPVALGGIKGGEDSGITETTRDVLLEAAYFTPLQIRQTSKALGLATEASYRFERGTDPEIVPLASDRAAAMIAEIAGGEVSTGLLDVYPLRDELASSRAEIPFRRARYSALTGLDVELSEAGRILKALGFEVASDGDDLSARGPSWRIDISIEEDLIEEVARISGYDRVQTTLPAGAGDYLPGESGRRAARRTLTSLGYNEAVSFSFVNEEADRMLSDVTEEERLVLLNPIDETQSRMRTTLQAGLLQALEHNFNHGNRNVRLFEIGKCFRRSDSDRPLEMERLALLATGARNESDWQAASAKLDFYDFKGALEALFPALDLPEPAFAAASGCSYLHPGRAAVISIGESRVGLAGQLHPTVAARYKFKQPVFIAELELGLMLGLPKVEARYQALPRFPTVVRDLALLIDRNVSLASIEAEISSLAVPELVGVKLFDIYSGRELPEGRHSIALSLRYRAADRTLTDDEINDAHGRIVKRLTEAFKAELR